MKIAWLHSHFLYWMGGTKFIYEVVKKLKDRAEIDMFVEVSAPQVKEQFTKIGIPVHDFSTTSSNSLFYWLLFPYYLRKDLRALRSIIGSFDIIVANLFPMNWLATRLNRKNLFYCYEPFPFFHDAAMISRAPFQKRILLRVLKVLYAHYDIEGTRKADKILTLNEITQKAIKEIYGRNAIVTHIGVDTAFFTKKNDPEVKRKYSGNKVIVHTTDYSPLKGTDLVIRAFAEVTKEVPNAKLLITSTKVDKAGKKQLIDLATSLSIAGNVEFLGFVDHEMMPKLFGFADVVVQGSFSTKSGAGTSTLPVKEALACETPVVRNPLPGESNSQFELLADPRDTREYAQAIINLLKNPSLASEMGRKGRAHVKRLFTWDKVSDVIWQTLIELKAD